METYTNCTLLKISRWKILPPRRMTVLLLGPFSHQPQVFRLGCLRFLLKAVDGLAERLRVIQDANQQAVWPGVNAHAQRMQVARHREAAARHGFQQCVGVP